MAYIPKKPFAEVVLPIMVKKGSIMVGISTYGEPTNFFTKLLNYRAPDGSRMFRQIEYTTICKKCLAKGVKEVCKHRRGELPHWHDAGEYAQIFEMLKDFPLTQLASFVGIVLVIVFFVTSSDSGSLVIDTITAGGKVDAPVAQRVFWAIFEGLVAIVLLLGGGLGSLQAAAVATGIPFAFVLLAMMYSTYKGLKAEQRGE